MQAVVFDMDGLMIDTEPIYQFSLQKAAKELGYEFEQSFFFSIIGQPNDACRKIIAGHFGPDFPLDTFWKRWQQIWKEHAESTGISIKPGLTELLAFLNEHRIPKAVATSSDGEQAAFSLKASGLGRQFSHIVTGDQIPNGKPAPDIYLEAARRLGVDPEKCVALEDSETGILSATSAGMTAIMVPDLKQPSDEVRAVASHVLDSLYEAKELIQSQLV